MIEIANSYYIYTISNDLIMNINRKIRVTMVEIITKDSNRATMVEIITKDTTRATMVEIITKDTTRATMVEIITKDTTRTTMEDYNKRIKQGHYGGNIEQ